MTAPSHNGGCYFHGDDPILPDHYRVCGECGHAFTAQELLAGHNAVLAQLEEIKQRERDLRPVWGETGNWLGPPPPTAPKQPVTDPEHVAICPLCGHDF